MMQSTNSNKYSSSNRDEIDLREIFNILSEGKWIIVAATSFASILAITYSLSLPNLYQSTTLLNPVQGQENMSSALNNFSSLASLTGLNLPSSSGERNSVKAIKKLQSLSFFEQNIMPNINLSNLMAIKSWNKDSKALIYDENIYDVYKDKWLIDYSDSKKSMPSSQDSFAVFYGKNLSINEDSITGFITLSVKHQSPYIAQKWAKLTVDQINSFYREKDKAEAEASVKYLNEQITKTNFVEIKLAIAALLQLETQKLTLIEANQYYVFDYIDPPAVMEKKAEPNRSLICMLGAFIGSILGSVLVLIKNYRSKKAA